MKPFSEGEPGSLGVGKYLSQSHAHGFQQVFCRRPEIWKNFGCISSRLRVHQEEPRRRTYIGRVAAVLKCLRRCVSIILPCSYIDDISYICIYTWNLKNHSLKIGCFSWMIPNLCFGRWLFHQTSTKHWMFGVSGIYIYTL